MISQNIRLRRQQRVRGKLKTNLGIPRLSVHRTNKNIWAQIIDDKHGRTLVASSSKALKSKGTKTEIATSVGKDIATKAVAAKIILVRFDRGLFRYHGRVKALANGARLNGLKF